jgi:hypothetical protein
MQQNSRGPVIQLHHVGCFYNTYIESGGRIAIMNNQELAMKTWYLVLLLQLFFGPSDMRLKTLVDKVHTSSVLNIEEISYLWKDSMGGDSSGL